MYIEQKHDEKLLGLNLKVLKLGLVAGIIALASGTFFAYLGYEAGRAEQQQKIQGLQREIQRQQQEIDYLRKLTNQEVQKACSDK